MQPLDCLLRAERDKYTENDDSDLAGERAPAVKWLGQMEMHAGAPSEARTLTEVLVSVMVESGTCALDVRSAPCQLSRRMGAKWI
jgi:hypothetical protein